MDIKSALLITALLSNGLAAQNPPESTPPGFRVAVNLVIINVSATDPNGKQGANLAAEDFVLLEDGVKQDVKFFYSAEAPFHVALVVDTSGSTVSKLDLIRKAAERFLLKLTPEDRVAIVDVAGRVEVLQGFTRDRRLLSKQLRRLGTTKENGTLLHDAFLRVLQDVFRGVEGRKAVVFLSDAQDRGSETGMEQLTAAVYHSDAVLYGLLVDTQGEVSERMRIAETRFSRIALVLDARSSSGADRVKQAGGFLLDLLPASIQVCLVEHKGARRAMLFLPYTDDRKQLKDAIAKAHVQVRGVEAPSLWTVSGTTVLLSDTTINLDGRIQSDILNTALTLIIDEKPADQWQKELTDFARRIPDPSRLRTDLAHLSAMYQQGREQINALCDQSGGRSYDLVGISDLDNFYGQVAEELRRTYSLGYYSQAVPGRYHLVEVRLAASSQAKIRSRQGFLVPSDPK
jgi:Mg-chelatase subunit ChlD